MHLLISFKYLVSGVKQLVVECVPHNHNTTRLRELCKHSSLKSIKAKAAVAQWIDGRG